MGCREASTLTTETGFVCCKRDSIDNQRLLLLLETMFLLQSVEVLKNIPVFSTFLKEEYLHSICYTPN